MAVGRHTNAVHPFAQDSRIPANSAEYFSRIPSAYESKALSAVEPCTAAIALEVMLVLHCTTYWSVEVSGANLRGLGDVVGTLTGSLELGLGETGIVCSCSIVVSHAVLRL